MTITRGTRRFLVGVVLAVAATVGITTNASALSDWRTIASSRDFGPYPSVWVSGGTINPEYLRVVVDDGGFAGASSVSARISCRDANFHSWERSFQQNFLLPRTFTWDIPTWVTYCSFSASADNNVTTAKALTLRVQGRY